MKPRVAGVLAGDLVDISWLRAWLEQSEIIFAADGGGDLVQRAGFKPDFLVGDLDSVTKEGLDNAREVIRSEDQDTSDCDKLLDLMRSEGADSYVLLGSQGNRVDHMLATLHSVARHVGTGLIAYEKQMATVLQGPKSVEVRCRGGISALPLASCEGVSMENVKWPVRGLGMDASNFSSLSNQSEGVPVVTLTSGILAVFWEYNGLPNWNSLTPR